MWTKQITGKNNNISSFLFSSTRHTWRACSRAWQLRHLCSFCNGHHVSYFGPSICNSLPPHIRNATTINAFNHLLNLISSTSQSHLTSPIPIWCVCGCPSLVCFCLLLRLLFSNDDGQISQKFGRQVFDLLVPVTGKCPQKSPGHL